MCSTARCIAAAHRRCVSDHSEPEWSIVAESSLHRWSGVHVGCFHTRRARGAERTRTVCTTVGACGAACTTVGGVVCMQPRVGLGCLRARVGCMRGRMWSRTHDPEPSGWVACDRGCWALGAACACGEPRAPTLWGVAVGYDRCAPQSGAQTGATAAPHAHTTVWERARSSIWSNVRHKSPPRLPAAVRLSSGVQHPLRTACASKRCTPSAACTCTPAAACTPRSTPARRHRVHTPLRSAPRSRPHPSSGTHRSCTCLHHPDGCFLWRVARTPPQAHRSYASLHRLGALPGRTPWLRTCAAGGKRPVHALDTEDPGGGADGVRAGGENMFARLELAETVPSVLVQLGAAAVDAVIQLGCRSSWESLMMV